MTPWNTRRLDLLSPEGHVESYFLKLNDPAAERALWLRAAIFFRPDDEPRAEAWAIAYERGRPAVAVKEVRPYAEARFPVDGLDLEVADLVVENGATKGSIESAGHRVEWNLKFDGVAEPFVPLPSRFYDDALDSGKLVTPHPDLRFSGHYSVDGRGVELDGWRGMQGHNWGHQHPWAYAWAHCNLWEGADDLVVEAVRVQVPIGRWWKPWVTLLQVEHEGERHQAVLPRALWNARGRSDLRRFDFRFAADGVRIRGRFDASADELTGFAFENPDGTTNHCLNSKLARGELRLERRGRPPVEARTRAAALEFSTRDPGHGVRMLA